MRILLQRVSSAKVSVAGKEISSIENGLLLLLGITSGDSQVQSHFLAKKTANLRIFEDQSGKMNLSLLDIGGAALVVSQFTLYADTRKGRRPSFVHAASPDEAQPIVENFAKALEDMGLPVQQGRFGAHMQLEIHNDGPVTIWLERD